MNANTQGDAAAATAPAASPSSCTIFYYLHPRWHSTYVKIQAYVSYVWSSSVKNWSCCCCLGGNSYLWNGMASLGWFVGVSLNLFESQGPPGFLGCSREWNGEETFLELGKCK